jgi:hypothetical protein
MVEMTIWYSILTFQDHTLVTCFDKLVHNHMASQSQGLVKDGDYFEGQQS